MFRLDMDTGIPVYQQIVEAVRQGTATGRLRTGEQLPTIRELALQLRVNPNTIARAYQELEREGIVETRRGAGSFVAAREPRLEQEERRRLVARHLDRALAEAYHLGLPLDEVEALLRQRRDQFLDAAPAGPRFAIESSVSGALVAGGGMPEPPDRSEP